MECTICGSKRSRKDGPWCADGRACWQRMMKREKARKAAEVRATAMPLTHTSIYCGSGVQVQPGATPTCHDCRTRREAARAAA